MKTLAKIVQFFVVNELALRGRNEQFMGEKDFDLCFDSSAGNFVNMIKFTAGQDPQFHEALKLVPQNAKYTSASIQNEIIFIFKHMMLCTISKEINTRCDLPFYCLKCDGTRDAVNTKILSVVVRYSIDATVHERLLALSGLDGRSFCCSHNEANSKRFRISWSGPPKYVMHLLRRGDCNEWVERRCTCVITKRT